MSAQLLRRTSFRSFSHNKINLSENHCAHTLSHAIERRRLSRGAPSTCRSHGVRGVASSLGGTRPPSPPVARARGRSRNVDDSTNKAVRPTWPTKLLVFSQALIFCQKRYFQLCSPLLCFAVWQASWMLRVLLSNRPKATLKKLKKIKNINGT